MINIGGESLVHRKDIRDLILDFGIAVGILSHRNRDIMVVGIISDHSYWVSRNRLGIQSSKNDHANLCSCSPAHSVTYFLDLRADIL